MIRIRYEEFSALSGECALSSEWVSIGGRNGNVKVQMKQKAKIFRNMEGITKWLCKHGVKQIYRPECLGIASFRPLMCVWDVYGTRGVLIHEITWCGKGIIFSDGAYTRSYSSGLYNSWLSCCNEQINDESKLRFIDDDGSVISAAELDERCDQAWREMKAEIETINTKEA